MREYFQAPSGRPKVFGMTASPIWNPKNAAESLATLERNLDAKVIAVREYVDELTGHSPKPEEVSVLSKVHRQFAHRNISSSNYTPFLRTHIPSTLPNFCHSGWIWLTSHLRSESQWTS